METLKSTASYWSKRYQEHTTGWDVGHITPPLKAYFDQLEDPTLEILIPGAGNAYEAAYLHQKGFSNVHILDFSPEPLKEFQQRNPSFPKSHIHQVDFFEFSGKFDRIIEQTFFCALHPSQRHDYALKMLQLLKKEGKLVGLLFDAPLNTTHPPYGGNRTEYQSYFATTFRTVSLEPCYNSLKPRAGRELFIRLIP